jgi:branched-chain amino acid transport system ATP-binding protein
MAKGKALVPQCGARDQKTAPFSEETQLASLRVDKVSVAFGGIQALSEVSFEVDDGQICGLIGPNGAGKSTLFNCLSRLYPVGAGRIELHGRDLTREPRHRIAMLGIGRTFQNLALFKTMSVRENVLIGARCKSRFGFVATTLRLPSVREAEQRAEELTDSLLALLSLEDVAGRRVADLPFGSQKRVELARALATEPRLLLLDEPACGLNHQEIDGLAALIRKIRNQFKVTVLLVEHHMGLVMGLSDKIVALNFGRKIAEGSPAEVRRHPDVITAYLGAAA